MAFFGGGSLGNPARDPSKDMGGANGQGRQNVNNAPIVGTAMTRADYVKQQTTATPPPSTAAAMSLATGGAKSAAERQRKRAAAGSTLANSGQAGPGAVLQPKTLLGA